MRRSSLILSIYACCALVFVQLAGLHLHSDVGEHAGHHDSAAGATSAGALHRAAAEHVGSHHHSAAAEHAGSHHLSSHHLDAEHLAGSAGIDELLTEHAHADVSLFDSALKLKLSDFELLGAVPEPFAFKRLSSRRSHVTPADFSGGFSDGIYLRPHLRAPPLLS